MNSLAFTTSPAPATPPPAASPTPVANPAAAGAAPVGPADFFAVLSGLATGARDSAHTAATEPSASSATPDDTDPTDEDETATADATPSGAPAALAFAWPPHLMPPPPPTPPPSATGERPALRVSNSELQGFALPPDGPVSAATGIPAAPATEPAASASTGEKLAVALDQIAEAPTSETGDRRSGNFLPAHDEALTEGTTPLGTEDAKASFTMAAHRFSSASADALAPGRRTAAGPAAGAPDSTSPASSASDATAASPDDSASAFGATPPAPSDATLTSAAPQTATAGFATVTPAVSTASAAAASASSAASPETTRELSGAAGDAVAAIGEVVELTHEFRARERSSVEVKFHFSDDTDLSVRVACRAGEVSVKFHTDSPELRATLGREWQERIGATSAALETRGLRLADPVFAASTSPAASTGADASGAAPSDPHSDARDSHHRAATETAEPLAPLGRALRGLGSVARGAFAPAGAPAAAWFRPDTVRHLLAFA